MKLNDWHINSFPVKCIFKRNPLIIKLKFSIFMKIYSVFYAFLLNHIATDPLPDQWQEPWEPVVTENGNWAWYVNCVLNSKLDRWYSSLLLKYYIDWEGYFSIWKPFHLLHNCQNAFDKFHISNSAASEPHINPCTIPHCQYHDPSSNFA